MLLSVSDDDFEAKRGSSKQKTSPPRHVSMNIVFLRALSLSLGLLSMVNSKLNCLILPYMLSDS